MLYILFSARLALNKIEFGSENCTSVSTRLVVIYSAIGIAEVRDTSERCEILGLSIVTGLNRDVRTDTLKDKTSVV